MEILHLCIMYKNKTPRRRDKTDKQSDKQTHSGQERKRREKTLKILELKYTIENFLHSF